MVVDVRSEEEDKRERTQGLLLTVRIRLHDRRGLQVVAD